MFLLLSQVQIPWESDVSKLEGDEVKVIMLDKFPVATSISHNFVSGEKLISGDVRVRSD